MVLCLILLVCCVGCHRAQFWDQLNFVCICFHMVRYLDIIILAITSTRMTHKLYISFKCKDPLESLTKLNMCISDIQVWMIKNKFKINDSKTEFIIFRSPLLKQNLSDLSISVGDSQVFPYSKVRDLGVVLTNISLFMIILVVFVSLLNFTCVALVEFGTF